MALIDIFLKILNFEGEKLDLAEFLFYRFGVYIGNFLGRPFAREIIISLAILVFLFFVLFMKEKLFKMFTWGRISKKTEKLVKIGILVFVPSILLVFLCLIRYKTYDNQFNSSQIVVADFEDSSMDHKCYPLARQIAAELKGKTKKFSVMHFDWPHADFNQSLLNPWIAKKENIKIVIGGSCYTQDGELLAQIDFKILSTARYSVDGALKGEPIRFSENEAKGFKINIELSRLITTAALAVEAIAIECGQDCKTALERYVEIYDLIPKQLGTKNLASFIAFKVANISYWLGNKLDAEEAFLKHLSFYSEDYDIKIALGDLYALSGKLLQAANIFEEICQKSPRRCLEISGNYSSALVLTEQMDKAEKNYRLMRSNYADHQFTAEFWNAVGISAMKIGATEEGLTRFLTGVNLYPDNVPLLKNLAEAYLNNHQFLKAEGVLDIVLSKSGGDDAGSYRQRGLARLNQNRASEALEDMNRSLDIQPTSPVLVEKAHALATIGKISEARSTLAEAKSHGESDSYFYYVGGIIDSKADRCETAIKDLEQSLKMTPKYFEAAVSLIKCYKKKNLVSKKKHILLNLKKSLKNTPLEKNYDELLISNGIKI